MSLVPPLPLDAPPNVSGKPNDEMRAHIARYVEALGYAATAREMSVERHTLSSYLAGFCRAGSITFIECILPHAIPNLNRAVAAKKEKTKTETTPTETSPPAKKMRIRRARKAPQG